MGLVWGVRRVEGRVGGGGGLGGWGGGVLVGDVFVWWGGCGSFLSRWKCVKRWG